jgi:hypothetical protein
VNPHATQAIKAAAIAILRTAGAGFLAIGGTTTTLAMLDSSSRANTSQGAVWMIVGLILMVFSHFVPRPDSLS